MGPLDIRIHKAIADQINIVNYANKIQFTWQLINMELKQNLLEIGKTVARVTKMPDKSIKSTLDHGRKAETNEVVNEIVDWILINRSLGISVSSWELIIKA